MAHTHDSSGKLLGGLSAAHHSHQTPQAAAVAATAPDVSPQPPESGLNCQYGSEEVISDLLGSYGTFAYASAPDTSVETLQDIPVVERNPARSLDQQRGCRNAIETPDERRHCEECGGDYCTVHAEPAAHDCQDVLQS